MKQSDHLQDPLYPLSAFQDAEGQDHNCLPCGLREVQQWAEVGPVAPPVAPKMTFPSKPRQASPSSWLQYAYPLAAAIAVIFLAVQIGRLDHHTAPADPLEAKHILPDSARNDTAFQFKKKDPFEDSLFSHLWFPTPTPTIPRMVTPQRQVQASLVSEPISAPRQAATHRVKLTDAQAFPLAYRQVAVRKEILAQNDPIRIVRTNLLS